MAFLTEEGGWTDRQKYRAGQMVKRAIGKNDIKQSQGEENTEVREGGYFINSGQGRPL